MKFSENWLRSHVPTSADRDGLAATLTAIGLEVEEVTALGDGLAGVVVARIVEAVPHPQADRLQVCQVDAGGGELLQIVCGAPNARVGLVAPLATVGSSVGGIAIKAAKLPHDKYQTVTIINSNDAIWGTSGFVKSSAEDSKK